MITEYRKSPAVREMERRSPASEAALAGLSTNFTKCGEDKKYRSESAPAAQRV